MTECYAPECLMQEGTTCDSACPQCGRRYHRRCLRTCRWCRHRSSWTCECGRASVDVGTKMWTNLCDGAVCPHEEHDTEDVFVERSRSIMFKYVFAPLMMLILAATAGVAKYQMVNENVFVGVLVFILAVTWIVTSYIDNHIIPMRWRPHRD
jgi:hypothetical protein